MIASFLKNQIIGYPNFELPQAFLYVWYANLSIFRLWFLSLWFLLDL